MPYAIVPNQSTDKRFLGVVLPLALHETLKTTAQSRGCSASDIVRAALTVALSSPKQESKV